ncbi:MAG: hypothetical protein V3T77_09960 [Planctomycetota bacterium]
MKKQQAHSIQPVQFRPGESLDGLPVEAPQECGSKPTGQRIRGQALIIWDPKQPGKKLDAIDTDQITPSTDCVSESLEALDKRWKEGSFRHLMPDFRKRVHSGENFLIAGERFAIGSSREMSPAGLKAVAEEAGLELVVVCSHNMGDIFRRNSLNLGLHVLQCPEAVQDARDEDTFSFDPVSRQLTNETQEKHYPPLPLTAKEEEIRRSGGIIAVGRRELRSSAERHPSIEWPDPDTARGLTTTEQIIWAHRVDKEAEVRPGATLRVYADLLPVPPCACTRTCSRLPMVPPRLPFIRSIRSPVARPSCPAKQRSPTTTLYLPARKRMIVRLPSERHSPSCTVSKNPTTPRLAMASFTSTFLSKV